MHSSALRVQCCFTYTDTVRTIRDREPRTSSSTFMQLLSSVIYIYIYTHTHTWRNLRLYSIWLGLCEVCTEFVSREIPGWAWSLACNTNSHTSVWWPHLIMIALAFENKHFHSMSLTTLLSVLRRTLLGMRSMLVCPSFTAVVLELPSLPLTWPIRERLSPCGELVLLQSPSRHFVYLYVGFSWLNLLSRPCSVSDFRW